MRTLNSWECMYTTNGQTVSFDNLTEMGAELMRLLPLADVVTALDRRGADFIWQSQELQRLKKIVNEITANSVAAALLYEKTK